MNIAKTNEEYLDLLSKDLLPIKNFEMAKEKILQNYHDKLSTSEIETFLSSCKFVGNGIGHFDFEVLARKLTYVELYEFVEMFGISKELFDDVKDAKCDGNHNCVYASFSTCMSSC